MGSLFDGPSTCGSSKFSALIDNVNASRFLSFALLTFGGYVGLKRGNCLSYGGAFFAPASAMASAPDAIEANERLHTWTKIAAECMEYMRHASTHAATGVASDIYIAARVRGGGPDCPLGV